jgi:hypothetical protein
VALFASALTPYEVFFFSSRAVEERWSTRDLITSRVNVFVGFPLGGLLAFAVMLTSATVFHPLSMSVDTLSQVAMPAAIALGKLGLVAAILVSSPLPSAPPWRPASIGRIADLITEPTPGGTHQRDTAAIVVHHHWDRLLGYERHEMTRPWILEHLARLILRRNAQEVPWHRLRLAPDEQ